MIVIVRVVVVAIVIAVNFTACVVALAVIAAARTATVIALATQFIAVAVVESGNVADRIAKIGQQSTGQKVFYMGFGTHLLSQQSTPINTHSSYAVICGELTLMERFSGVRNCLIKYK